jgi:hypothetical protein
MTKANINKNDVVSTTVTFLSGFSLIILVLNLIFFTKLYFSENLKYQGSALEISGPVTALPEITDGTKVTQTFVINDNGLSSVAIQVGTFMRKNDIHLVLTLADQTGKTLRSGTFSLLDHADNTFLEFSFDPILNSKGKTMILSISSPDSKAGNAVTLWATGSDTYPQGKLRINDKYLQSDLVLSVKYLR